jgi:DNA polymerase III delta prime subunit
MNNQLFIVKYKPKLTCEYALQSSANNEYKTFKEIITQKRINSLLIGHHCSGKSTFLETLINEYYLNDDPKLIKNNCLYINNLKDQGINYYRNDVKTFCQTCSSINGKQKIVILDDIDMINEQSQQVFRNFIDKFEKNVLFLASCCNIQKVIESLQSRFIIFKLPIINHLVIKDVFDKIKHQEGIEIDKNAENFLLNLSNNNIKILITYMQKFKLFNKNIDFKIANKLCCNINFIDLEKYTNCLKKQDLSYALDIIYEIYDTGYSVMDILDTYFTFIKKTNILNEDIKYKIIPIICKYITIFYNIHEDEIELSLFTNNLIELFN